MPYRYVMPTGVSGGSAVSLTAGSQGLTVTHIEFTEQGTANFSLFVDRATTVSGGSPIPIRSLDDPAPAALATGLYGPTSSGGARLGEWDLVAPVRGFDLAEAGPISVAAGDSLVFSANPGTDLIIYFEE